MLEGYNVSKLLDENGKFRLKEEFTNEELPTQSLFVKDLNKDRSEITLMLSRYYLKNLPKLLNKMRISSKINGNQKLLLEDTISDLSLQYPEVGKLRGFLMDTAALESSYKLNSQASKSTASGWFGFIDATKKDILQLLGIKATRELFNNNPEVLVLAAVKLYQNILKLANKLGVLQAAALRGFTQDEVVHAYWLNPKWAKEYFLYGRQGGTDAFGTSVEKYINKIRGIK